MRKNKHQILRKNFLAFGGEIDTHNIMHTLIVTTEYHGLRLDQVLTRHYGLSRNFFHHLIERKLISVNNKPKKKSYRVHTDDVISCESRERFDNTSLLLHSPSIDIPVIAETPDYIIIHKPRGVLSHPTSIRECEQASVVGFLAHRYHNLPSIGHFIRAGLVHRLDRETSGIMLCVLSERGLAYRRTAFHDKSTTATATPSSIRDKQRIMDTITNAQIRKRYNTTTTLTDPTQTTLRHDRHNRPDPSLPLVIDSTIQANTPHSSAKRAITWIRDIHWDEATKQLSTLTEIITGRTHQIRIHLRDLGCPLDNDYLYQGTQTQTKNLGLTAIALGGYDDYHQRYLRSLTSQRQIPTQPPTN